MLFSVTREWRETLARMDEPGAVAPLHGWIILDKPYGLGSTQAVGAVKRCLREAGLPKAKIGHGGTLDPLASGVLPIAIGEATKLCGRMLDSDKAYDFTIRFGEQTDTLDAEGNVIATKDVRPTLGEQMPPAYSALKVDGRRAYDLARAGEDVALKARSVSIYSLVIQHPLDGGSPDLLDTRRRRDDRDVLQEVTLSATVSKGTPHTVER